MNTTAIEYLDLTWNPLTGCNNRCQYCYARRLANTRLRTRYLDHLRLVSPPGTDPAVLANPFSPQLWPERLYEPFHLKKGHRIGVVFMGDLFGPWVRFDIQSLIIDVARNAPHHTFLFLTKFPYHLHLHNPWPANCWVGVTASNTATLALASNYLSRVDAPIRFVSLEPLTAPITEPYPLKSIDWLIIGGQTHPDIAPDIHTIDSLLTRAQNDNIPVFIKPNAHYPLPIRNLPSPGGPRQ